MLDSNNVKLRNNKCYPPVDLASEEKSIMLIDGFEHRGGGVRIIATLKFIKDEFHEKNFGAVVE